MLKKLKNNLKPFRQIVLQAVYVSIKKNIKKNIKMFFMGNHRIGKPLVGWAKFCFSGKQLHFCWRTKKFVMCS
jgi:hypothetical protein